jgi:pimeloyl-ACP methyl ester carboxylesterase
VALAFARLQPRRVRALVLVRPAWIDRPDPRNLKIFREIARLLRSHGPEDGKRIFLTRSRIYRRLRLCAPSVAASLVAQFDRPHARERAPVLDLLPAERPLVPSAWAELAMPALVLGSRRDPVHPYDVAITIRQKLPKASFQEVPPKDPDERAHRAAVTKAIESFLN